MSSIYFMYFLLSFPKKIYKSFSYKLKPVKKIVSKLGFVRLLVNNQLTRLRPFYMTHCNDSI